MTKRVKFSMWSALPESGYNPSSSLLAPASRIKQLEVGVEEVFLGLFGFAEGGQGLDEISFQVIGTAQLMNRTGSGAQFGCSQRATRVT